MAGKRESTASSGAASSKKPKGNNAEDEPFPEEVDQVDEVGDKLGSAVGSHPEGKFMGIEENGGGSDAKSPSDDKLSNKESEYGGDSEEYRPRARFIGDPFLMKRPEDYGLIYM
ncbi:hypothetical protein JCGZ_19191 [Jatropha curcas]|uniref:Uncharacterized protein n=1 Tax=Jatropha curcas TaxID=180498 RepID=A0A067LJ87_JATCU|nr:uncharacterized protein LOC119371378 [Jatropha curcas]KDP44324.1 hypothetical protein JCGZ_19191 [Jatropha curcas]